MRELRALVSAGALALALRLGVALSLPELELDAYGHLKLAAAFLRDPGNLSIHWVWLPGWHAVLAGGLLLGAGHTSVRVANALIQTLGPWLLYVIVRGPPLQSSPSDRTLACNAALFYTVAPLPNFLGASALAETGFSLLLLCATGALLRQRGLLAGGLLGSASLIRYEAWGAVALLGVRALQQRARWRSGLVAFLVSAGVIAAWVCLRRLHGLPWLSFASGTKAFVERYRASAEHSLWASVLVPALLPLVAFGPAIFLAIPGLRALRQRVVEVPAGILLFLLASTLGGGMLALPRYFTALTPFVCIAMAEGTAAWCARPGAPARARAVALVTASLALTTLAHLAFALYRVRA